MPLNRQKIYGRTLKNQQKRAAKKGWAADDPRIERRAQRRAGQRMDFRKGIQSGDIQRPGGRLERNMAFRDFIGQGYDPQRMERRFERRRGQGGGGGGQYPQNDYSFGGPFGGGGPQGGPGGGGPNPFASGKGGGPGGGGGPNPFASGKGGGPAPPTGGPRPGRLDIGRPSFRGYR